MRKKYDVEDILDKGQELLRTQGYNNTGIDDILKACGIPKGSFYNFFSSKEDFGVKALDYYGETQAETVRQMLENPALSPLARLKQFYANMIGFNVAENCRNGCLVGNLAQEMGGLSHPIAEAAERNFNRIIRLIEACVVEAQEKNEIRRDYSAHDLANYLHNSFYGALMRSKAERMVEPFALFSQMMFRFLEGK